MLTLHPYDPSRLAELAALRYPAPSAEQTAALRQQLEDPMRGKGEFARMLLDGDQVVGMLAWVSAGIAKNGEMYGGPLQAASRQSYDALIDECVRQGVLAGARYLHFSAEPDEALKLQALAQHGFAAHFCFLTLEADSATLPLRAFPAGWRMVETAHIDWRRLADLYNRCFEATPHAPGLEIDRLRDEWAECDLDAAQLWADENGGYQAFLDISATGHINGVGVSASCAGRGIAQAMYGRAALHLQAKGQQRLSAMVADSNSASMALHRKLGFQQQASRQVLRKTLA
ncbi:GNAT family N-acetyltransferase [Chromobacterium sp. IIBBL 290-4]|uniref:GNAT family N-acetyltransferase n=1 Tax=Chromobacterium sp. IIBBL 290-4 TaxID=2953890 RepID=UPI0020B732FE|nr:GNAT family N-acetyltransferase [Chromobacterium sp. IIBBL 290-4]UTH76061.1 GNAT family N-acetyltransferase [Chromobacterium sp. IIBBL 290-4]